MNYLTTLKLLQSCNRTQDIKLNIDEISFENEQNQIISIPENEIDKEIVFYNENSDIFCNLLIIDKNNRIEELFDEEYTLRDLELSLESNSESIPFCFIEKPMEEVDIHSLKDDEMLNFVNGLYKDSSLYITGVKPDKLFGYDLSVKEYQYLAKQIYDYLESKIKNQNISFFVTSGKLGIETVAFFSILKLKEKYPNIYNVLAVPYLEMDKVWDKKNKERYQKMLKLADKVIEVDELSGYQVKRGGKIILPKIYHEEKTFQLDMFLQTITTYETSFFMSKGEIRLKENSYNLYSVF